MDQTVRRDAELATPRVPSGIPLRLAAAAPALWRVIDRSGRVVGHLQALSEADGIRYRVRRFHPPSRAFLDLGEFWRIGEAIDCLRFAT
ncbi:hypothetical protein K0817_009160 [Microbacterium sp. HD4P20]|uniref:hypothetical protein n=1 Tax=Microbacterium sp. HD4P20 TaxID=2864874 RepID=UPI001C63F7C4|nr:hypothetical protein [Microbacterium sp. HD4P20]MCP2636731.1 hypothetical protein [Microbacterium sp. HD4P20]